MKVRVGFGVTGLHPLPHTDFAGVVDAIEVHGLDSLWLSERMGAPSFDPVAALSFAAGRTQRIKLGTSVSVLPGRNPAEVAKTWASLDVLSGGRALPAFGLGVVDANEQQAFGVAREERAARFDEMLPLVRRLWSEPEVTHDGRFFTYTGVRVEPKPTKPLDVWLGGKAPAELRRVGRLGDGWLASFTSPKECEAGRVAVDAAAHDAGRTIDPEHFGAMVFYTTAPLPESVRALLAQRRPDTDVDDIVVTGLDALRERCTDYVRVGFSKLVAVPFTGVDDWVTTVRACADAVADLQN